LGGHWFGVWLHQAALLVDRNRVIQDGPTINTLPRMKHEEEIGKPFQHHQPFAPEAFHGSLLVEDHCDKERK
jgi:hypothetical protein